MCVQNAPFKATSSFFNPFWLHLLFFFPGSRAPRQAHKVKNLHFTGAILAGYYTAIDLILPMPIRIILGTLGCFFSIEILIF